MAQPRSEIAKRYNSVHLDENRARAYSWRERNPEAWKLIKARSYQKNRERTLTAVGDYRFSNADEIRERDRQRYQQNPEPKREATRRWMRENPGAKAALDLRRRESRANATPPWLTVAQKVEINAIYKTARHLTKSTGVQHHVDHIEPLVGESSCGLHVPWNLQILTDSENMKKGNRLPAGVGW